MNYAPYILKNIYETKDNDTNFLRASLAVGLREEVYHLGVIN